MIQIAVAGANGRVGRLVVEAIHQDQDCQLAATLLRDDSKEKWQKNNLPIDVIIDFTTPAATLEHLALAREKGYKMVIGTTGFTDAEKQIIQAAAQDIPIILSPNMSVGVNLTFKLLQDVAESLQEKAAIKISDIHHAHKKDAPSGTALKMAEIIKTAQRKKGIQSEVEFESQRIGENVGDHSAVFMMQGESLEITHKATDRALFAKGALLATKWLVAQKPGLYDMQDVLGLRR